MLVMVSLRRIFIYEKKFSRCVYEMCESNTNKFCFSLRYKTYIFLYICHLQVKKLPMLFYFFRNKKYQNISVLKDTSYEFKIDIINISFVVAE